MEGLEILSGLVKGEVAVIVDDTVDHNAQGDVSPREPLDLLPHPREVREGQAPHGRHSGPLHGQDVHGFPYAVRKMLDL